MHYEIYKLTRWSSRQYHQSCKSAKSRLELAWNWLDSSQSRHFVQVEVVVVNRPKKCEKERKIKILQEGKKRVYFHFLINFFFVVISNKFRIIIMQYCEIIFLCHNKAVIKKTLSLNSVTFFFLRFYFLSYWK